MVWGEESSTVKGTTNIDMEWD